MQPQSVPKDQNRTRESAANHQEGLSQSESWVFGCASRLYFQPTQQKTSCLLCKSPSVSLEATALLIAEDVLRSEREPRAQGSVLAVLFWAAMLLRTMLFPVAGLACNQIPLLPSLYEASFHFSILDPHHPAKGIENRTIP